MIELLRLISLVTLITFVNSQAPAQCRFANGNKILNNIIKIENLKLNIYVLT